MNVLSSLLKVLNLFMEQLNNTFLCISESSRKDCCMSRFSGAFLFLKLKMMLAKTKVDKNRWYLLVLLLTSAERSL